MFLNVFVEARRWVRLPALWSLGAIALLWGPGAAQALPQTVTFQLTTLVAPCIISQDTTPLAQRNNCVSVDSSATYPNGQSFDVVYDVDNESLGVVDFTLEDFFMPSLASISAEDAFSVNGSPFQAFFLGLPVGDPGMADIMGTFDTTTGAVMMSFNLQVQRNGAAPGPVTPYVLTTGTATVAGSEHCEGVNSDTDVTGEAHGDSVPNKVLVVGNACVDVSDTATQLQFVQMNLWGTLPPPDLSNVPEPGTLALLCAGLTALCAIGRSRS
jgi:hypothetical protein